jgi:hypothetical protein
MSVSYNRTRKNERLISRVKKMTISEVSKLNPEFKCNQRILNAIKENNLVLKP